MSGYPRVRLRRLRRTPALRRLLATPLPGPEKFIWPVFVIDGKDRREPIDAMPGQFRLSPDMLVQTAGQLLEQGIGGLLLFGVAGDLPKDATGSAASDEDGLVQRAVRQVKDAYPDALVATDVCLCAYTEHGHCGPLDDEGRVDNDAACNILARGALSHARSGADIVAPSAMMDGQVLAIRNALDDEGFEDTLIMSYSTKFASNMYGPFREAEQSAPQHGDRSGYQAPCDDRRQALRESDLDAGEGADILMVKPSLFYLDVLVRLRDRIDLPIAVYNVSGEYSMLIASADRGWGELRGMVRESVAALQRAGADVIISYWANRYEEMLA